MADELLTKLRTLIAEIAEHDERGATLRAERRTIVEQLNKQPGWSLERIGKAVGRTKQTVSQWLR